MELFGLISVKDIWFLIFCLFGVLAVGYALGRITIKGISLGDAGVFIVALLFGAFLFEPLSNQFLMTPESVPADTVLVVEADPSDETNWNDGVLYGDIAIAEKSEAAATTDEIVATEQPAAATEDTDTKPVKVNYVEKALTIVERLGLVLFVTSVGFIAGPKFFGNLKRNFKSYVLLGVVIIVAGGLAASACIGLGNVVGYGAATDNSEGFTAMIVGLLSGSLTSTPAFAAAKDTVQPMYEGLVTVGHGIAYIFGVLGVVLFVQIVPKIMKANMSDERKKLETASTVTAKKLPEKLFKLDGHGFAVFSLVALIGIVIGAIKIPGTQFSLTATGGCLLAALIFGHFGHFGKLSVMPDEHTLKLFRELGLVLFLAGAGIAGGADFVANFDPMYFVYGIIMTILPMLVGFFFAKYVLKLSLLNNLGSLTGGMTSTPALGTLIGVSGTESVAAAYAATYPIALIAVVLVSQFLIILF